MYHEVIFSGETNLIVISADFAVHSPYVPSNHRKEWIFCYKQTRFHVVSNKLNEFYVLWGSWGGKNINFIKGVHNQGMDHLDEKDQANKLSATGRTVEILVHTLFVSSKNQKFSVILWLKPQSLGMGISVSYQLLVSYVLWQQPGFWIQIKIHIGSLFTE